jgi:hypothetical protein
MNAVIPVPSATPEPLDAERYQLLSVENVQAPEGCAGRDWFVYRIAQGANAITGYQRGNPESVRLGVEAIVVGLNGRRAWGQKKAAGAHRGRSAAKSRLGGAQ